MNSTIMLFLAQDGITNGAIYALLGFGLVLVFAVTRVILIPQGEFITFGAFTYAALSSGTLPRTAQLACALGVIAFCVELVSIRHQLSIRRLVRAALLFVIMPAVIWLVAMIAAKYSRSVPANLAVSLLIVAPIGLYIYRIVYQPMAHASVLVLLIASVGVHLALQGMGLVFFGAEGMRAPPITEVAFSIGPLRVTGQALAVYVIAALLIVGLWLFFGYTLYGKALRATAVNRVGARLVGVRTVLSGQMAFVLAAAIGAISGILIVPMTTIYYDSGFLVGLKGFIAAIVGGLGSYPLTAMAAVAVGLVEAFSSFYASNFKEVIVFTLIVPVLLLRSLAVPEVEEEKD
ncbi:branched-chain amino acid ABC transporter permease [Bradyrhizobium sp.]|uniref:branched-chain amino acid ABC transporter permease n=1 Tax=Bradyrhizobium sp. TaxID=376 RepID=UPI001D9C0C85|nr:branched-chain amino acid ABC transporter permease [Bradyrhizobium sp.]MBI5321830.1 branched-chain amino acid ABC transporter permease [Bradyrhizobium sp.]